MAVETIETPVRTNEELRQAALDWINGIREEYGLEALAELPKGVMGEAGQCVLVRAARGLQTENYSGQHCGRWVADEWGNELPAGLNFSRNGQMVNHPVPDSVKEFVDRFDLGCYPDLVE